jgi:stress response protein YsnF
VWLDGSTGEAVWASVHTGLFGLRETFVPLQRAELRDDQVPVPVAKEQVKEAPRIDTAGDRVSEADQAALRAHYGLPGSAGRGNRGQGGNGQGTGRQNVRRPGSAPESGTASGMTGRPGEQARGRAGAGGDVAMTRSEERLKVGTEEVETGRVRLVKHVVTEHQQVTVAVENVRLAKERVTEEQTVSDEVSKERIDIEDDSNKRR